MAFVAHEDREVAGYCWGHLLDRPDGSSMAYIHEMHVGEGFRRRGIGRDLMLAVLNSARVRGASTVFLITEADNDPARNLYEDVGGEIADQGKTVSYSWNLQTSQTRDLDP
ncbi:MAG: GNAT family N-acetyltransferase [bacterium]|nr:GNAT family N-acetyltransferase [bacterium]